MFVYPLVIDLKLEYFPMIISLAGSSNQPFLTVAVWWKNIKNFKFMTLMNNSYIKLQVGTHKGVTSSFCLAGASIKSGMIL